MPAPRRRIPPPHKRTRAALKPQRVVMLKAATDALPVNAVRLIFKPELLARVQLSYPTIWKKMRNRTFPLGRDVGGKTAWVESEIENWIRNLPVRRYLGHSIEKE